MLGSLGGIGGIGPDVTGWLSRVLLAIAIAIAILTTFCVVVLGQWADEPLGR